MNPISLQDFHNDPALRRRLYEMAHRDRIAVIRAGFDWLRDRLSPRLHPGDWIGRLG